MLDRDELAARLAVADLAASHMPTHVDQEQVDEWAEFVVKAADALLARLRPEAVAPAPSPAASPAPYVPKVGDVVGIDGGAEYGETRVVTKVEGDVSYVRLNANGEMICRHAMDVSLLTYLRPATAAERAAAGLPPVDDPALEIALIDAVARVESGLWENFDACRRRRIVVDAVLPVIRARLKANGGAS